MPRLASGVTMIFKIWDATLIGPRDVTFTSPSLNPNLYDGVCIQVDDDLSHPSLL